MNPLLKAPSPHEALTTALPRVCLGLSLLWVGQGFIFFVRPDDMLRMPVVYLHAGLVLVSALLGWLAATRRLPGWRREGVFGALLTLAIALAGLRGAITGDVSELLDIPILAIAAGALLNRPLWWIVASIGAPTAVALAWIGSALREPGPTSDPLREWFALALSTIVAIVAAAYVHAGRRAWALMLESVRSETAESALIDPVTHLTTSRGLLLAAAPMVEHAKRDGQAVHCLVIDLDGLDEVPGGAHQDHLTRLLVALSEVLSEASRATDVVARWGSHQFLIVGPGTGPSPLDVERRIRARLSHDFMDEGLGWNGRVSVGTATLVPWDEGGLQDLLTRSEADMVLRRSLRRKAQADELGQMPRPDSSAVTPDFNDPTTPGAHSSLGK